MHGIGKLQLKVQGNQDDSGEALMTACVTGTMLTPKQPSVLHSGYCRHVSNICNLCTCL